MAELSKAQLAVSNSADFPDNTSGLITPAILRSFNTNMIDSLVDEISYNIDSASFSGSIAQLLGFSSSLDATFATDAQLTSLSSSVAVTTLGLSGSIASLQNWSSSLGSGFVSEAEFGAYSSSINSYTSSNDTKWNTLGGQTGSYVTEAESGSFVTSVLAGGTPNVISVTKGNGTINSITVNNVTSASFAVTASEARNVVVIARNGNASSLPAGTIVHITGASGDNPIFNTASYDSELLSANTLGMLRTTATSGADVEVLVNGIVTGVNTDPANGFVAGDIIYLSSSGQFTRVEPQAPLHIVTIGQVLRAQQNNGSIYVSINNGWELNELHNVEINSVADGDLLVYRSGAGLWTNSSSIELGNATTGSNTFTGTQTFNNIVVNGTGSFNYIQAVTGSAKVIGDAFIILNNDTPTERYAGLVVQDSGSNSNTASFEFDGQTNDWFYQYTNDGGVTNEYAVALFGPTYNTLGNESYPTSNRIQKGSGNHHLADSNISDDGTTVRSTTNVLVTGSVTATGGFVGNASTATTASWAESAGTSATASYVQSASFAVNAGLLDGKDSTEFATTASNQFNGNQSITGSTNLSGSFRGVVPQPALNTTSNIIGMTGSLGQQISQNIVRGGGGSIDYTLIQLQALSGSATSGDTLQSFIQSNVINNTSTFMTGSSAASTLQAIWATGSAGGRVAYTAGVTANAGSGSGNLTLTGNNIKVGTSTANITHITGSTQLFNTLQVRGAAVFSSSLAVSQSQVTLSNGGVGALALQVITGSVQINTTQGEGWFYSNVPITSSNLRINGPAIVADLFVSGVFSGNSSLQVSGNSSFTGSVFTSASVSGVVNPLTITSNTASLDFSKGNFFTVQLVSGSTTHINPTNVKAGQTINVRVNTTGSALVTFQSIVKQQSGSDYVPTTSTGVDILTMVTFDSSDIYLANVKNLI